MCCAANYVISFEVNDGFIGMKAGKSAIWPHMYNENKYARGPSVFRDILSK